MAKPVPPSNFTDPNDSHGWFGLAYALIFIAGVGFFLMSFIALAVLPGLKLSRIIASHSKADMPDYTPAELRGRHTYARLGCALCHTQFVRFVLPDVVRWGPPTEAWETRYDYPQLWGTRRIGPDLARESHIRSDDWQLTHLYHPQSVVPDSVMPSYNWLFKGSPTRPTTEATDLVAYLNTLGRAREAGEGKSISKPANSGLDAQMEMAIVSLCATPFINPHQARISTAAPDLMVSGREHFVRRGATLFAQNCAGCHGATGDGKGEGAAGLSPKPTNLRTHQFSTQGLAHILWNGVAGTAMPAWQDLPTTDLASLAMYVQTLHTAPDNSQPPATSAMLSRGAAVYATNCVSCHGVQGNGAGPIGKLLLPRPANFVNVKPDVSEINDALKHGVPGTSMPPWPSLSTEDKHAVNAFVRSMYKPAEGSKP